MELDVNCLERFWQTGPSKPIIYFAGEIRESTHLPPGPEIGDKTSTPEHVLWFWCAWESQRKPESIEIQ